MEWKPTLIWFILLQLFLHIFKGDWMVDSFRVSRVLLPHYFMLCRLKVWFQVVNLHLVDDEIQRGVNTSEGGQSFS